MTGRLLACFLLVGLALGQTAPKAPTQPAAAGSHTAQASAQIPQSPVVITIAGVCDSAPAQGKPAAACKTVVTRAEFERIIAAIQPDMSPATRKQFAENYATRLALAKKAQAMGLDKGPGFAEKMQLLRMQLLSQELVRSLQEQASHISDKEIEDYYHANTAAYETGELQRIYVPKTKEQEPAPEKLSEADVKKRQEDAEAAMSKEADALRARAAAGEDFDKLQAEAFQMAGMKNPAPSSSQSKVRRTGLPPNQSAVFDLAPGAVSEVLPESTGFFIYKLVKKETLPLIQVQGEIRSTLQGQKMRESVQALQQSINPILDENYFKVPAPAAPKPAPAPAEGGEKPPAAPAAPAPK